MTEYLSLKLYKAQFVQEIYEKDVQDRMEMCHMLISILQDSNIQNNIFFTDEAIFDLNGFVTKHNIRYWCETEPQITEETAIELSETKCLVCTLEKQANRTVLL